MNIILAAINEVLEESGRDQVAGIERGTLLRNDLGLDSLDLAVLTVKIEAILGVDVFAKGILTTVGDILDRIDER
ncbi:MAG TPA: acyl carrier protein [Pirellula sp.]|nr:acyl carrier protein [Pirellula sp.]